MRDINGKFGISYQVEGEVLGSRRYHVDMYRVERNDIHVSVYMDDNGTNVSVMQGDTYNLQWYHH